jgi:hypothetical protein
MSEKSTEVSLSDLNSATSPIPGFSMDLREEAAGHSLMDFSFSKTLHELSSVRSSSLTPRSLTTSAKTSTAPSSTISSDAADVALAALKSLDGSIARLRSQLNQRLNEAYCQRLLIRSQLIPSSIETKGTDIL